MSIQAQKVEYVLDSRHMFLTVSNDQTCASRQADWIPNCYFYDHIQNEYYPIKTTSQSNNKSRRTDNLEAPHRRGEED